jgi:glycosyltransferase involved in cell wall biosynthesis
MSETAMHIAFVCHEWAPVSGVPVARAVDIVASALEQAGHRITVIGFGAAAHRSEHGARTTICLEYPEASRTSREARLVLRDALLRRHAEQPLDVVEWPDADGWYLESIDGVADVLRLHGSALVQRRSAGTLQYDATEWRERHTLTRIRAVVAGSQWLLQDSMEAVLRTPESPVVARPVPMLSTDVPAVDSQVAVIASTYDPSSMSVLLALASGQVVVAPRTPATREIITHGVNGLLADGARPDDLLKQEHTLRQNARLRDIMRTRGQTWAREAHHHMVVATVALYERARQAAQEAVQPIADVPFAFVTPHARTGYGIMGANLLRALQARQAPVALVPIGAVNRTLTENPHLDDAIAAAAALPADAPSVRHAQQFDLMDHVGKGPRVGLTVFERDAFTDDERRQLHAQDALVVVSEWAREVCRANGLTQPIHVIYEGVAGEAFDDTAPNTAPETETVFLQVGKLEVRKGQFELLCAFEEAFTPQDPVRLILHCHNPFMTAADFETMVAPFRASPLRDKITLLTRELPRSSDVAALIASVHCGVYPVRAEGWNLGALETLAMGKTVIASYITGHTAFLDPDNARLIAIDQLEPAMGGALPGRWAAWGLSQHQQLVTQLQRVHAERVAGRLLPNAAGVETARRFSWDACAVRLLRAVSHTARQSRYDDASTVRS